MIPRERYEVPFYSDLGLHLLCHETSQPVAVIAIPAGTLLETNDAFSRLMGRSFKGPDERTIHDLAAPETSKEITGVFRNWKGKGERWIEEASLRTRSGDVVRGRAGLMPIPGSFPAMAFFQFVRGRDGDEIRLRQLLDDRVEQLRNLERLRSMGEVSSILVHQIRTPLTTVQMATEAVRKSPKLDSSLHKRLDKAIAQIHRIESLLTGIREAGKPFPLEIENFSVEEILEAVRGTVADRFPDIQWTVQVRPSNLSAFADPRRIREAIENLVVNAAQAMEGKGQIMLSANTSRKRPGWTFLQVQDDGPGMTDEVAARAFHMFFTTKKTGAGLGLSIVKKIVDLHGGFIKLDRGREKGVRVTLDIPPETPRRT